MHNLCRQPTRGASGAGREGKWPPATSATGVVPKVTRTNRGGMETGVQKSEKGPELNHHRVWTGRGRAHTDPTIWDGESQPHPMWDLRLPSHSHLTILLRILPQDRNQPDHHYNHQRRHKVIQVQDVLNHDSFEGGHTATLHQSTRSQGTHGHEIPIYLCRAGGVSIEGQRQVQPGSLPQEPPLTTRHPHSLITPPSRRKGPFWVELVQPHPHPSCPQPPGPPPVLPQTTQQET